MIKRFVLHGLFLSILFVFATRSQAQTPAPVPADTSKGKILEIIKADRENFQQIEGKGDFLSLVGKVEIKQGPTYFYCDSAVLDQSNNIIEAFGNVHINDADSVHTYSQYLKYLG